MDRAKGVEKFIAWLKSHEGEIASGENDFGELSGVFEIMFERLPGTAELRGGKFILCMKEN